MNDLSLLYGGVILVINLAYLIYARIVLGVLPSISESHYRAKKLGKPSLFTGYAWLLGVTVMLYGGSLLSYSPASALYILSGIALCFTGAASEYKRNLSRAVHFVGAITAIFTSLLGVWLVAGTPIPLLVMMVLGFLIEISNIRSKFYWIEVVAILLFLIGINYETLITFIR